MSVFRTFCHALVLGLLSSLEEHEATRVRPSSANVQVHAQKRRMKPDLKDSEIPDIMISAMNAAKAETSETSFFAADVAEDLMIEIQESFAEPLLSLTKNSSRSGAKLFLTSNKKFFLKTIADSEYDTLWKWVHHVEEEPSQNQTLGGLGPSVVKLGTNIYRSKHCTALVGLGQTRCKDSLLVPFYVGFKHSKIFRYDEHDEETEDVANWYFLLMPAAFTREEQALQSLYPELSTNYLGELLDLKPLPSRSEIDKLAPKVKSLSLPFEAFTGIQDVRQMLSDDTDGLNDGNRIDYSMLVWSAQFEAKSEPALELPGCIQSCKPAGEQGVSCVMLCFSLIDYLVEYTFLRHLEDKYKYLHGRGDKFEEYGEKTNDMMHCLGNLPVYGLEYLECMPYLQKACKGIDQEDDAVCKENAEDMETIATSFAGDLFDDVKGAAHQFAEACGSVLKFGVKWSTSPLWLPVVGLQKLGGLVGGLFDSRSKEEIQQEERLKILEKQIELKLQSENEKAAFQFWCQKRVWRQFREDNCVKVNGLRWRHDYKRWEATWRSGADRFLYSFKVEVPTKPDDFEDDWSLRTGLQDFDTALDKALECLRAKDAETCARSGTASTDRVEDPEMFEWHDE